MNSTLKGISLFLLLVLCFFKLNANQVDSLQKVYLQNPALKQKLSALTALIEHYKAFNLDSALLYCRGYEELIVSQEDDQLTATNNQNYASVFSLSGDYTSMTPYAYNALNLFKKLGNQKGQIEIYLILGRMFAAKKEFPSAYAAYNEALKLEDDRFPELLLSINLGISNAKFLEEKADESEIYLNKCLQIIHSNNFKDSAMYLAKIYTNLGNIKSTISNDLAALDFYKKSFGYYTVVGDKFGISLTSFNIGDVYCYNDQYDSALKYFNITQQMGEELRNFEELYYAYLGYTEVYERKGDFAKAFEFQQIKFAYKDSLQSQKYDKSVVELEKKYDSEKKATELATAEEQLLAAKREKDQNQQIIWLLAVGSGLFVVLSIALLFFYRRASKANQVIKLQSDSIQEYNKSIDKALKQKEILLKEVHHRVKNNLQLIASLLNLQLNKIDSEEARKALEESKSRVLAIALMHKGLYQDENFGTVNVKDYLDELIENQKVLSYSSQKRISFEVSIEEIKFTIDQAVPTGLIISELISNSLKHAFEFESRPVVSLTLKKVENQIFIHYSDNGSGLPENFVIEEQDSLGFVVISALTEQLGGTLTIDTYSPFSLTICF